VRYWVERLHTATYLLNRLPTKTISASCPHHALFGTPPTYEHLRVFGYECYPNMSATAPHKLAPRSTHCVFLGYSEHHKGYRCLNLSTNHLVISRHVVFDEAVFPYATSPHRATDLQFLLSETAPVVSPIGTCLPAGSTAPRAATLEPSLTDAAGQATPLANGHPPLVSRGPDAPTAPLEPSTHVPRAASASTPSALARPARPHQPLGDRPAPRAIFTDPPAPGPQDAPV
jgi:hypothetical protein